MIPGGEKSEGLNFQTKYGSLWDRNVVRVLSERIKMNIWGPVFETNQVEPSKVIPTSNPSPKSLY